MTGTENIIRACHKLKISRCVYTSTPSVAFGDKSLCGVTEAIGYPEKYLSIYHEDHVDYFIKLFNLPSSTTNVLHKRNQLLEWRDSTNMKLWSIYQFPDFLYWLRKIELNRRSQDEEKTYIQAV